MAGENVKSSSRLSLVYSYASGFGRYSVEENFPRMNADQRR
jgi:hypothetical protein